MKKILSLLILCCISFGVQAQKNKSKNKASTNFPVDSLAATDSLASADSLPPPPVSKSSKKGKDSNKSTNLVDANTKNTKSSPKNTSTKTTSIKKGKDDKKDKKEVATNFKVPEAMETPVADTAKKFIGIIKYKMTSDDPAQKDSMFIIFGENQIRVTMFTPGYREGQIFEDNMIANFSDSTFTELDVRQMTFKKEKLGIRNTGFGFNLANNKKTGNVMNILCDEYKGEMTTPDEDVYEAACLLSKNYQYMSAMDFNFLNIQPVVLGYKIVLGFRTRTPDNESTFIIAYKIEPGNTSSFFDLSQFRPK